MKILSLLSILFLFYCNVILGQTSPAPTIVNAPSPVSSPEKRSFPKTPFADLVGLKGQTAPQFILSAIDKTEYNLENLRGKIVVVNLWGTFCAPCITEIPELNALVKKYKDKEIIFLAPAPDDRNILETFLQKHPFDYQVLPNGFAVVEKYAPHRKSNDSQKPGGFIMLLPTHLVIDQTGIITYHNWGYNKNTAAELGREIEKLLTKNK